MTDSVSTKKNLPQIAFEGFMKVFKFLPYWLFIPICYFLYKIFFWIPEYLREYAFYLRVPIISAILIFLLFPLILTKGLRNVLIMSKWQQVSLGIIAILLTGRSIVVVANAILENAPTRFGTAVVPTFVFPWDYVCSVILGLPLIWGIISQTHSEEKVEKWKALQDVREAEKVEEIRKSYEKQLVDGKNLRQGCLFGFLSTLVLFVFDKLFLTVLEAFKIPISALLLAPFQWLGLESMELGKNGYFYQQDDQLLLAPAHLTGLSFFLIALFLFLALGVLFRPNDKPSKEKKGIFFCPNKKSKREKGEAPVIIYMMAFLAIVVPILGTMTFVSDQSKFPVVLTAICFVALSYWLWDVDYYFRLEPSFQTVLLTLMYFKSETHAKKKSLINFLRCLIIGRASKDKVRRDFETAVKNRLKFQGSKEEDRTLVVVTASGGGIQAAGWTAQVLAGLQDWLGADFTRSIGLISSVSGGSVGSLFFVDYCEENGAIAPGDNLKAVVRDSVQDALDTAGWGLVYRDLGNIVGLPFLSRCLRCVFKISDRGEALEYSWQNTRTATGLLSKTPANSKTLPNSNFSTLDDWGKKALAGEIPIPVFNTTLVEDGRRMLFSPMTFSQSQTDLTIDSNTLYAGHNMRAVTAARLSATFPYVSPTSRNPNIGINRNYHIVDGGYFDNSGIVTAVDWLDNNMNVLLEQVNVKRLVLLEIEAFEQQKYDNSKPVPGRGGFLMAFFAPFFTLSKVKTASLVVRNEQEIDLLIKRYRSKLDETSADEANSNVQHVKVEFPSSQYKQPLSWKLAPSQKYALERAWEGVKRSDSLQNLQRLWNAWGFSRS
jgi:hypothetical protein